MQKIIYTLVKDILEEATPFVSFEVDDAAMTFTCNQFDNPIVLAITGTENIFDCEKSDPNQIVHVINTYNVGRVFPYEDHLSMLKKHYRSRGETRKAPSLKKVTKRHGIKVECIEAIMPKLPVILNTIKMNFLSESTYCRIDDREFYFVRRSIPDAPEYFKILGETQTFYRLSDGGRITIVNYDTECTLFSKSHYENPCEMDILKFCDENMFDENIFSDRWRA